MTILSKQIFFFIISIFYFEPLLCFLLEIQLNLESLLTPGFYKPLYASTAVENLVLTDRPDSIYKSDAFYRDVDE